MHCGLTNLRSIFPLYRNQAIDLWLKPALLVLSMLVVKWVEKYRSSHREVFCKRGVLKNFTEASGKHRCWSLFFNIVAALRLTTIIKNRLQQVFSCEFCEFLRISFYIKRVWWLFL